MEHIADRSNIDIPEFGYLYFDGYVLKNWDAESPLSKEEQKRSLVESWTRLGKFGRNEYSDEDILFPSDGHPSSVPQDLLSLEERQLDGEISSTLWVRTWFGKKDDKASQDAADAAYKRLMTAAFFDENEDEEDEDEKKLEFVFDRKEEFGHDSCTTSDENGDADPEIVDGLAVGKPGSVPSYLITAIMHCPGQFDGNTHPDYDKWRKFTQAQIEEELPYAEKSQSLMVCVADRKACEDGLVLFLGINHRGQVLPFRLRDKASKVGLYEANWMDGQALHENASDPDKDVEYQMCKSDDGWGPY